MRKSNVGFETDLRISLRPALVALAGVGIVVLLLNNTLRNMNERWALFFFAMLIEVFVWIAWQLNDWQPRVGQWFVIAVVMLIISGVSYRLDAPVVTVALVIPVALTAALISLTAAAATTLVGTALVLLLRVPGVTLVVALGTMWGIFGVMLAVYQPVFQVAHWAWDYFQRAQNLLEEARDRRAELERTLKDLADANVQLTRLNSLAQGLRQAAEDARTAKEQFVANVSHELRTPLNMITGFSEMILQSPEMYGSRVPPALLADLAVIHRNAEHLASLVDDVLDLSQVEAKQMALTKEYVHFSEIVENAAMAARPLFKSKGLYLTVEVPEDLPPVFCDRTRIREVLLNLLSNAGRFTEQGGITVRVWQERGHLMVAVVDTGRGIAASDLGKLFLPFQQIDGSIRRRYGGTGLGLSISKRFIELHDGEIDVESEEGVGTTFTVRLPLSPPAPAGGDFSRWLTPGWEFLQRERPTLSAQEVRPRYVVLESGDVLQRLLTRYVDQVEIAAVQSLDAALRELARIPAQALLVNNLDVGDVLERLKAADLPGGTPVVVCSIPNVRGAATTPGVDVRLVKPISRDALLSALDQLGVESGTVLVVDDEPDALQLFGRMLASSERAYRVLLARDGQEALAILHDCHAEGNDPDVVLLDLVMPNLDGFQLLAMREQDPAFVDIPIVVISARDPAGQPIVSSALAVMRGGGLSIPQVLTSIEFVTRAFAASA